MNKIFFTILTSSLLLTGCAGTLPTLGIENGLLMQCPEKENCVSSQAKDQKHFIEPIISVATQLETKEQILDVLNESPSAEIKEIEDDYIRAQFSSSIFRFVDDVEFYFPDTQSEEIFIYVRSASRVGKSDFGVNRKRIEEIRHKLNPVDSDQNSILEKK